MKKHLRYLAGAAVGAVVALGFSSCAYDPYYSSGSVGYSSGYGDGYGYGGSSFSTSVFIGTGDPRWGYDPYCYSYYDYNRRCYYDPYLNGYYPVGYRPPVVYGVPHPYGWRPGRGYIRPPGHVSYSTVGNYRNREYAYRNSNYGWAKQVRQRPVEQGRTQGSRPAQNPYDKKYSQPSNSRYRSDSRPSNSYYREGQTKSQGTQSTRNSYGSDPRRETNGRLPSRYNTPVTSSSQQAKQYQKAPKYQQSGQYRKSGSYEAPQKSQKSERAPKEKSSDRDQDRVRGYR